MATALIAPAPIDMVDLLLQHDVVLNLLLAVALGMPLLAWLLWHFKPGLLSLRLAISIGALGPFALLFWGYHNLVLAVLGFDSVVSLVVVLVTAMVVGTFAGRWVSAEPR